MGELFPHEQAAGGFDASRLGSLDMGALPGNVPAVAVVFLDALFSLWHTLASRAVGQGQPGQSQVTTLSQGAGALVDEALAGPRPRERSRSRSSLWSCRVSSRCALFSSATEALVGAKTK